jgi:predicted transcriptional regulator of viral defense system
MRGELPKTSKYGTESGGRRLEQAIAELAALQHGVVALSQLREIGLSESAIRSRAARGRLHRVHAGIYAVGHRRLTRKGHWMAAVLACGPGAALSHRAAGALLGIRPAARRGIEVTAPRRRQRPGIDTYVAKLTRADVTTVDGIPCTTAARTLLDLAAVVDRQSLEKAINEAEVLQLFDLKAVNAALERAGRRRGTAALRETLTNLDPLQARTRSELERRFLTLCRRAGLPPPEVNAWIEVGDEGFQVDFLWRRQRLVVETDGWATHSTRRAFERDRRRILLLMRAHFQTVPVTWRQVIHRPDEVIGALRAGLSGEGGIRTHEAAFTAHAISSRAP